MLESAGQADAEVLADHFRGAGDGHRARELLHPAGDKASAALAFDHAAQLYRRAIERSLRRPAVEAIAISAESWATHWPAAAGAPRPPTSTFRRPKDATAAETLELTRLASTQLLISGHVDEGLALLRTILGPLGLNIPRRRDRPSSR